MRLADDGDDLRRRRQRHPGRRDAGATDQRRARTRASRRSRRCRPRSPRSPSSTPGRGGASSPVDAAPAAHARARRDLPHPARRPVGHDVGIRRRLRRTTCVDRAVGQPAGRHRHRGQDLPRQRRSGARDAPRPRRPRGRSPRCFANPRAASSAPPATRASCSRSPGAGARAARTNPTCATPGRWRRWGVIRWRAAPNAGEVEVSTRQRQHRDARRDLERVVEGLPNRRRRTDRQPERALPAVAGGADRPAGNAGPVLTSVTAAYLPRNLRPEISSITVHPAGTVFQRPFSTGELEIAGFEDNTSDGRAAAQPGGHGRRPAAQPGAGARPPHLPEGAADVRLEGRRRERRSAAVRRALPARRRDGLEGAARGLDRSDLRVGHDVGARRHLLREGRRRRTRRRTPRRPRWSASSRASASTSTTRAPTIEVQPAARAGARATISFVVRDEQSPVQRVEYSLDASRWRRGLSEGRHCRLAAGGVRGHAGRERGGAQRHHPRDRRDEQRRDRAWPRSSDKVRR